jgi:hypothetical protein
MKKVEKHGLKMVGLKKACNETKSLYPLSGLYVEMLYNKVTGDVSAKTMTINSYTLIDDEDERANLIRIPLHRHHTMQELATYIYTVVNHDCPASDLPLFLDPEIMPN